MEKGKFVEILNSEKKNWIEKNVTRSNIISILDRRMNEVLCKHLGFTLSFGNWEIDHCNGRSEESAIGVFLKNEVKSAMDKWISSLDLNNFEFSKRQIQSIKKEYQDLLLEELRNRVREKAIEDSKEYYSKIIEEIVP